MVAPNDVLGYYHIIERLGAGGMGEVWKAEDTRLGRIVAVKILPARIATDHEAIGRMRREARTAAQINSANIATIYSFEEIGERLFIVMEYVEGEPLTKLIERGPLQEADLCRIGRSVAEALSEAHAKGIIHRDIKPDNIIVNGPRVKVLDFGIAKQVGAIGSNDPTSYMTQEGVIIGTVQYMSPEQALGKPLDARTDIFSLGVVLYEAATGRLPFRGETITETITQIVRDEPPDAGTLNGSLSPNFTRIIARCLRKPREQRFESAADLASVLDAQLSRAATAAATGRTAAEMPFVRRAGAPSTILTGSKLKTVQEPAPRKRGMVWVAVAAILLAVLGIAAFIAFGRRAPVIPTNVPVVAAPVRPANVAPPSATEVSVTAVPDTSATTGTAGSVTTVAPTAVAPTAATPTATTASASPDATSASDLYALGMSELRQRRLLAARNAFLATLAKDPAYSQAHLRLGEMALLGREPNVAREQFRAAIANSDRLEPRERKLAHLGIAITNANWDRARELAGELQRENPDDPDLAAFRRFIEQQERDNQQRPRRFRRP